MFCDTGIPRTFYGGKICSAVSVSGITLAAEMQILIPNQKKPTFTIFIVYLTFQKNKLSITVHDLLVVAAAST